AGTLQPSVKVYGHQCSGHYRLCQELRRSLSENCPIHANTLWDETPLRVLSSAVVPLLRTVYGVFCRLSSRALTVSTSCSLRSSPRSFFSFRSASCLASVLSPNILTQFSKSPRQIVRAHVLTPVITSSLLTS